MDELKVKKVKTRDGIYDLTGADPDIPLPKSENDFLEIYDFLEKKPSNAKIVSAIKRLMLRLQADSLSSNKIIYEYKISTSFHAMYIEVLINEAYFLHEHGIEYILKIEKEDILFKEQIKRLSEVIKGTKGKSFLNAFKKARKEGYTDFLVWVY